MDLKDVSRTVFYSGPVVRRTRGDTGFLGWTDLTATLLDNYCELARYPLFPMPILYSHLDSRCEKSERGCEATANVPSKFIFNRT